MIEQLRLTFESQLYLMSAEDMRDLITSLSLDKNEAIEDFCEHFDLEGWYEDALKTNKVDVREWLIEIADEAEVEEILISDDERTLEYSIRAAQGW